MTPQWIRLKQLAMGSRYPTKAEYFESIRPAIIALLADMEAQPLPPPPGEEPAPQADALAELERWRFGPKQRRWLIELREYQAVVFCDLIEDATTRRGLSGEGSTIESAILAALGKAGAR